MEEEIMRDISEIQTSLCELLIKRKVGVLSVWSQDYEDAVLYVQLGRSCSPKEERRIPRNYKGFLVEIRFLD
jgi:hypothetical protein